MKLRLASIFMTDFPALAAALAASLLWFLSIAAALIPHSPAVDGIVLLASPLLLVVMSVLCWRAFRVWKLFDLGQIVQGTITSVGGTGFPARIEFTYKFNGEACQSWMPVHRSEPVLALQPRQKVGVLLDPRKPTTAIIAQLFAA